MNWSTWTDFEIVKRRAGGRRHYNSIRRFRAALRRRTVSKLLLKGLKQSEIAQQLGVHRTTIWRDVQYLTALWRRTIIMKNMYSDGIGLTLGPPPGS